MSDKGNGFIFLIRKSNELVEIDSRDAKFNETFADYREQQGKLTKAPYIDPDLKEEKGNTAVEDSITDNCRENNDNKDEQQQTNELEQQRDGRQKRMVTPRTFLHPGTVSDTVYRTTSILLHYSTLLLYISTTLL